MKNIVGPVVRCCARIVVGVAVSTALVGVAHAEGTLRVGAVALPPPDGNPYAAGVFPSWHTWTAMYDALTVVDEEDGSSQPALATEWQSLDQNTWRFKLRAGVTFDNGEPLNAQTVVAAIDFLKNDEAGKTMTFARQIPTVTEARAVDAMTVDIVSARPDAILPSRISGMLLVAPKAWKEMGVQAYARQPIGTGSFKVARWTPELVVFEARSDSWRPPKVSRLEVQPLPERATRVQALLSDQIDIAVAVSIDNFAAIEGGGHTIDVVPSTNAMAIPLFNAGASAFEPFKDKRVRQALNYAVDKEAMAEGLLEGRTQAASQGATPNTFGYDPNLKPYPFDPAKARSLLTEAGYPNGFKFVAEVVVNEAAADQEVYLKAAQDLAGVGIEMEVRQITKADWIQKFITGTWGGQAAGIPYNSAPFNDITRFMGFEFCKSKPYFCVEEIVPKIAAADAIFDSNERRAYLRDLAGEIRDLAPSIYLVEQIEITGVNKRLRDFKNLGKSYNYDQISIAQ
ncbi:MAG: ABC transporter substrate-binding protein [Alphaproteobacteria bacterium]